MRQMTMDQERVEVHQLSHSNFVIICKSLINNWDI